MANPQLEDGKWMQFSNEILEALLRTSLPDSEWRVLWAVIRKTWGWKKKSDHIPVSQIAALTGIPDRVVSKALASLKAKKMISRDPYSGLTMFLKDFDSWGLSTADPCQNRHPCQNSVSPPVKTVQTPLSKMTDSKETLSKDTFQKTAASSPSAGDNPTELMAEASKYRSDDERWPDMIAKLQALGYVPRIGKDIAGFFDGEWKRKSPRGGPWLVNAESLKGNLSFIKKRST